MTGAKINTPPPVTGDTTSVENIDKFLEAQASEDFVPVEYKVVHFDGIEQLEGNGFENFLNGLGAVGWDLVHSGKTYMIFSRC